MEKTANLRHWEDWAKQYGAELRATTKCLSIKRLEIEALVRQLRGHAPGASLVFEVGCGNGANGFALAARHDGLRYVGVDFSPAMIANALAAADRQGAGSAAIVERMAFAVADARELALPFQVDAAHPHRVGTAVAGHLPAEGFDAVFTDRMLINLASPEEQLHVMRRIADVVRPGGLFLMIENSAQSHATLNRIRAALGLPPRPPAEYNVFIDEERVIRPFAAQLDLVTVENFSAVHDLMLYAVEASLHGGEVQYDSAVMTRLTDALLALGELGLTTVDPFGQNRLWVWRKRDGG